MGKPYTVTRSTSIAAPAERIRGLLNDFHEWRAWSPWEGVDPAMTRTFSGPASGVGAAYAWEGNKKAGKGSMLITADRADRVDVALTFEKPFPAKNRIEFALTPTGSDATTVDWVMHGELNLLMRAFAIVKSMESLVGPDFERGLATLKAVAEAP